MQGILNQQDALVPSSPSFRRTTSSIGIAGINARSVIDRKQVASDSPGHSRDAENVIIIDSPAGENGQPGRWLCKSSLQETVGYAERKLPAGVANDWVTRRSPVACLADLKVNIHHVSPSLPSWRPPLAEGGACRTCLHAMVAQCTVWPAGPRE